MPSVIQAGASSLNWREFAMVDEAGAPVSGQAGSISVRVSRNGVSAAAQGAVTEPDPVNFPGIYHYTFAAAEIASAAEGYIRPTLGGAVSAVYPFTVVAFNPTAAPLSAPAVATAVRTELAVELGRVDAAVSTRATPAQARTEVTAALNTQGLTTVVVQSLRIAALLSAGDWTRSGDTITLSDGTTLALSEDAEGRVIAVDVTAA